MKKSLSSCLFLLLALAAPAAGADAAAAASGPLVPPGSVLSLERCLEIAESRHPELASAASAVAGRQASYSDALTAWAPQVNGSASYNRVSPTEGGASSPAGGTADFNSYSAGVSLNQNIYDFGRTRGRVGASQAALSGARDDLANAHVLVALGVRQGYFNLLKALRSREVAKENLAQSERGLAQAKGFFEAGTKTRFDVTTAEVTLANARLALISAENGVRLAVTSLANAMGLSDASDFTVEDVLVTSEKPLPYPDALARAMSRRGDLRSADAAAEAARRSLDVAEAGSYPTINGSADYSLSGRQTPLGRSWSAGVNLSVPLFTGDSIGYQAAAARAALEGALARREQLRQSIQAEVQQAGFNAAEAAERIPTAELSVRQAQDNLDLANGRYNAGVGSPIEVADAQTALFNQKNAHIQALYDYQAALAALRKATGDR